MVLAAANYLDDEAVIKHLPWMTPEEAEELLKRRAAEEAAMIENSANNVTPAAGTEEVIDSAEDAVGKTLNGAQTQSLIQVMGQLSAGALTEGQAIAIIATAIGVTKAEAKAIIRGE